MTPSRLHTGRWVGLLLMAVIMGLLIWGPKPEQQKIQDNPFTFPAMQTVGLEVGAKQMQELQRRRTVALARGVLQEDDSSWVKAVLKEGKRSWNVRIRLKGDWTDHLEGRKWSFRVEVRDDGAWRGLREFSLLSPERRAFLDEWVFHQALTQEGVLTPRYDFISLHLNDENLGTYAVEEHFTPEMLARQGRMAGPILRFEESGMWDARVEALRDSSFPYLQIPFQEAAAVRPFQQGRTLRDSLQAELFHLADQLMRQYREGSAPPAELFDLDKMARYYALMDLFGAYHSLIWHNRRYYYNPLTSKLEPVVFDAYSGQGDGITLDRPYWGYGVDGYHFEGDYHDVLSDVFFRDAGFVEAYRGYLRAYSDFGYLDGLFRRMDESLQERESFLRTEYWGYQLRHRSLVENADRIRSGLGVDGTGSGK
jgi:hypothetical protein